MADIKDVTNALDGAAGGGGSPTMPADTDVVSVKKTELDKLRGDIEALKKANQEIIDTRQKAKAKADEEAQRALDAENAKKTTEQKLADMQAEWNKKWTEKEATEKAEKDKLQAELKTSKLINSITGLQGLRPDVNASDILTLIQGELKYTDAGDLDQASLITAIKSRPFLMAEKEITPKVPMAAGKSKEKEPGVTEEPVSSLDVYMQRKKETGRLAIPGH